MPFSIGSIPMTNRGHWAPKSIITDMDALRTRFWIATSLHIDPNNYVYYGNQRGEFFGLWRFNQQDAELRVKRQPGQPRTLYRFSGINGALTDATLFLQESRAPGLVGGLRQRPADHAAVDGTAVGAGHDAALGQIAQILAHGLHADAETMGQRSHLHAAMLAHEFTDLQASLTGVAGGDHGHSL